MKKELICKVLYGLSIILVLIFIIRVYLDYKNYDQLLSSAPFSAYVLINGVIFIIPSIIFLIVAIVLSRRKK